MVGGDDRSTRWQLEPQILADDLKLHRLNILPVRLDHLAGSPFDPDLEQFLDQPWGDPLCERAACAT